MQTNRWIIGIDEAGRGPLAGPVSVAATMFLKEDEKKLLRVFAPIKGKDSKKLSEKQRDFWFGVIEREVQSGRLKVAQAFVGAKIIDAKGIVPAVRMGIAKVLTELGVNPMETQVLLDGSLKAPAEYKNQKTIIRGDEKELAISLASIIAKVVRDEKMRSLAKKYPAYGFDKHKGYGTREHREAIEKWGLCEEHRRSYCHVSH